MGAEYCPYCAAQRWSTIVALSRFGTWSGLGNMASYSGDVYPNTPTFTFINAKYTSKYVVFKSVEMYTNYIDAATSYYAKLQTPTAQEQHEISTYDTSKYIKGLTSESGRVDPLHDVRQQVPRRGRQLQPARRSRARRATPSPEHSTTPRVR